MSSQASATGGISAREAEVLTLVAQHLSNADAFISELTEPETTVAETAALAERAVELAHRTGDPLAESARWTRWPAPEPARLSQRCGTIPEVGAEVGAGEGAG